MDWPTARPPASRFVIGIALALFSASNYIGAFGRALNTIYEVEEGRPIWKLRPCSSWSPWSPS